MTNGSILNNNNKSIMLYRGYTKTADLSTTLYNPPTKFKVGINNGTPDIANNDLNEPIPIENGTINDDGSNHLTGSSGGTTTTDNIVRYKVGGGTSDVTAQNLIANNTSVTKVWTISNLATNGNIISGTKPFGFWLHILDSTTLDKFTTTNCLSIRFGSDSSNYYSISFDKADLSTNWNWINSGTTNVEDLTETGTVSGNIAYFSIIITTNNATDTFTATTDSTAEVVYDMLRQWESSDLIESYVATYPQFDYTNKEVKLRCYLSSVQATAFDINGLGLFNEDTSPLMSEEDTFTAISKDATDEIAFVVVNRMV